MPFFAQVGYYTVIQPAWPDVMARQAREHFVQQGLPEADIALKVAEARQFFTLTNYAVSSAVTALVLGVVLSAVFLAFIKPAKPV